MSGKCRGQKARPAAKTRKASAEEESLKLAIAMADILLHPDELKASIEESNRILAETLNAAMGKETP